MLVKCKTEGCKNYDVLIERNLDVFGGYAPGYHAICPECGEVREKVKEEFKPSIGIDELSLSTKRMYENKITKY